MKQEYSTPEIKIISIQNTDVMLGDSGIILPPDTGDDGDNDGPIHLPGVDF